MRLLIAGSRGLYKPEYIEIIHNVVLGIEKRTNLKVTEIVHGACKNSPDISGKDYGEKYGLKVTSFPADWYPNGVLDKSAGYKRNVLMGEYADILLVIYDGKSSGTKHMMDIMNKNKKKVIKIIL